MDPVDADMVLKTLTKEYSSHPATAPKVREKVDDSAYSIHPSTNIITLQTQDVVVPAVPMVGSRHDSVIVDLDLKDDSSDDGDDEITTMDSNIKKVHSIKNVVSSS
jgi:hypothetical protein